MRSILKSTAALFARRAAPSLNFFYAACVALQKSKGKETEEESGEMTRKPYQEFVGSFFYVAVKNRSVISVEVKHLGQKVSYPRPRDWVAAKRDFRYSKGTVWILF